MMRPHQLRLAALATAAALIVGAGGWMLGHTLNDEPDPAGPGRSTPSSTGSPSPDFKSDDDRPLPDDTPGAGTPTSWDTTLPTSPSIATPSTQPSAGGTPRGPLPDRVDQTNPDQVADAFVIALLTVDTRIDSRPATAGIRAAVWADKALAADLRTQPAGATGAEWNQLVARDGWTSVTVDEANLGETDPDTTTAATRVRAATVVTNTADAGPTTTQTIVAVQLTKTDGRWTVTRYTLAE